MPPISLSPASSIAYEVKQWVDRFIHVQVSGTKIGKLVTF